MVSHPTLHRPTTHSILEQLVGLWGRGGCHQAGHSNLGFWGKKTCLQLKEATQKEGWPPKGIVVQASLLKDGFLSFRDGLCQKSLEKFMVHSIKSHSCCHVASCERYSPKSTRITETTVHRRQGNILYVVVHVLFLCISSTSTAAGDSKLCDLWSSLV